MDEGKTGTTIKGRRGLQELLQTVQSGSKDFDLILVYDVSRWGRFPDADEAAHYEYLCKKAGIGVRYCAEQFENDNSTTSNLLKALKRTMAGEYSRELSVKVCAGQRRLAAMGWWQGGFAPFGMLRQIVSQDGRRKQILKDGQWKSISTDRVILTPGPQKEVDIVCLIFDLYTKQGKSRHQIADILNDKKLVRGKRAWDITMLRLLLTNPVYKGAYAYGKYEIRNHSSRSLPREKWLIRDHAFPAIISDKQWNRANEMIRKEMRKPLIDSEMLEGLRRLWKREGTINSTLINEAKDIPSTQGYRNHFRSLNVAYKQIGFPLKHDFGFVQAISLNRKMRSSLCDDLCMRIRAVGGTAQRATLPGLMVINGNITVKVTFSTGHTDEIGLTRWVFNLGKKPAADILIIARLDPPDQSIFDYYAIPAISGFRNVLRARRENSPMFVELHRFPTLEPLVELFRRHSIERPV